MSAVGLYFLTENFASAEEISFFNSSRSNAPSARVCDGFPFVVGLCKYSLLEVSDLSCDALVDPVLLHEIQVIRLRDSEVRSDERTERVAPFINANSRMSGMSKDIHPLDDVLISRVLHEMLLQESESVLRRVGFQHETCSICLPDLHELVIPALPDSGEYKKLVKESVV